MGCISHTNLEFSTRTLVIQMKKNLLFFAFRFLSLQSQRSKVKLKVKVKDHVMYTGQLATIEYRLVHTFSQ